jgi:excisionase family DNA binding protein
MPFMLTVDQAAKVLSIGRTNIRDKIKRYLESGGAAVDGIPAVRIGKCVRVPRDRLLDWIDAGCVNVQAEAGQDELLRRRRPDEPSAPRPSGGRRRGQPPEQPPLFPAV